MCRVNLLHIRRYRISSEDLLDRLGLLCLLIAILQKDKQTSTKHKRIQESQYHQLIKENFLASSGLIFWWDTTSCLHGETDQNLGIPIVSDVMSRNRFGHILWNLHVNDNAQIPQNNTDKLYKLRPLIASLNDNFLKLYDSSRYLSID